LRKNIPQHHSCPAPPAAGGTLPCSSTAPDVSVNNFGGLKSVAASITGATGGTSSCAGGSNSFTGAGVVLLEQQRKMKNPSATTSTSTTEHTPYIQQQQQLPLDLLGALLGNMYHSNPNHTNSTHSGPSVAAAGGGGAININTTSSNDSSPSTALEQLRTVLGIGTSYDNSSQNDHQTRTQQADIIDNAIYSLLMNNAGLFQHGTSTTRTNFGPQAAAPGGIAFAGGIDIPTLLLLIQQEQQRRRQEQERWDRQITQLLTLLSGKSAPGAPPPFHGIFDTNAFLHNSNADNLLNLSGDDGGQLAQNMYMPSGVIGTNYYAAPVAATPSSSYATRTTTGPSSDGPLNALLLSSLLEQNHGASNNAYHFHNNNHNLMSSPPSAAVNHSLNFSVRVYESDRDTAVLIIVVGCLLLLGCAWGAAVGFKINII
jgi:hypothetical protein